METARCPGFDFVGLDDSKEVLACRVRTPVEDIPGSSLTVVVREVALVLAFDGARIGTVTSGIEGPYGYRVQDVGSP